MRLLLLAGGLLAVLVLLIGWFMKADPAAAARLLRRLAIGVGILLVVGLLVTGRLGLLLGLAPVLIPLALGVRAWLNRSKAAAGPSPGQSSQVKTRSLRMSLDHDTGHIDGEVLAGPLAGRRLSDLDAAVLLDLLGEVAREDPDGLPLLEAYLDRQYPDWRQARSNEAGGGARGGGAGTLSRRDALDLLELEEGATEEQIREAHRRLMRRHHPDAGGSNEMAAALNRAKDLLLKDLAMDR